MRVLAADTTTPRGSLAVVDESGPLAEARVLSEAGHSRWLLPATAALLDGLGWRAADLDLFAATTGPGSFTGLRVGLSSVQGLALAAGRPCVGIPTLEAIAATAPAADLPRVSLLEAYRGEVYWAAYDAGGQPLAGPGVSALETLLAHLPAALASHGAPGAAPAFVGEIAERARERILAVFPGALVLPGDPYLAATLGRRALVRAAAGQLLRASELLPIYVRGADVRPPRP